MHCPATMHQKVCFPRWTMHLRLRLPVASACLWLEPRHLILADADEVVRRHSHVVHDPCAACLEKQLMQLLNKVLQRLQRWIVPQCLLQYSLELVLVQQRREAVRLNARCRWLSRARHLQVARCGKKVQVRQHAHTAKASRRSRMSADDSHLR